MILVRRLLYLMVVLLSVTCVVAGEAQQEAELAEVSQMNSHTAGDAGVVPAGVDDACKAESPTTSDCSSSRSETALPRGECADSSQTDGCHPTELKTEGSCPDDSKRPCAPKALQEVLSSDTAEHGGRPEHEHQVPNGPVGPAGGKGSNSDEPNKDKADGRPDGAPGEQNLHHSQAGKVPEPVASPAAAAAPAAGNPAVPVSEEGTGNSEQSTTDESVTKAEDAEAQPSPSPTNSTQENTGDNNTNTGNDTKPAEGGSPSNQEDNARNTETTTTTTTTTTPNKEESTTTTTTTTLPPELTNNKKGDADSSSSSISSSVWVRVPLLIVVTLACILVC
ncbi:uncharacterized protein TM35_001151080 [Trypanosoma theileri]|uniref:Mucin-associated surface protein (MASP) n=1 Tax=Trypanosoma theileri TaxID=67003 RepID=A0A1X0NEH2_9TRYP|nr:uncharacterized protein TM35_001151080 [Trypanosoma theileri]ORC81501.1 hypothetical protein TM35_001151080 [Trypanosoma theileri]